MRRCNVPCCQTPAEACVRVVYKLPIIRKVAVTGRDFLFQRPLPTRVQPSFVAWLLLALLVAGAAAYSHGTRYALVAAPSVNGSASGHVAVSTLAPVADRAAAASAELLPGTAVYPAASTSFHADQALPCLEQGPSHRYHSAWYTASRGEPSPTKAFALSPPQARQAPLPVIDQGDGAASPVPARHALTVVQLSISRT